MLDAPGLMSKPIVYDGLTARIAQHVGFRVIGLGGYALGASTGISEPLLSLEEVLAATRRITGVVDIPLMVDAGTGYGDPVHVVRTVREFERAGAAAIHIEDQVFPKRAHYHKGIEHTISADEMCTKIHYAKKAQRDPDFVIVARTDTMATDDFNEGVRRANLYAEAGADMVMIFPNNVEEAKRAPKEVNAPLVFVNSEGNRLGRPIFSVQELEEMGYKMGSNAIGAINVAAKAVKDLFVTLHETGSTGMDQNVFIPVRKDIEDTIGLDDYYRIEEETVEK